MENIEDLIDLSELEDIDLDDLKDATYEVWALGIDKHDNITDTEVLLGEFEKPEDAVAFACTVDLKLIKEKYGKQIPTKLKQFNIEVETVVCDEDEDYTENVGTIFRIEVLV